jgi:hypothetical protein
MEQIIIKMLLTKINFKYNNKSNNRKIIIHNNRNKLNKVIYKMWVHLYHKPNNKLISNKFNNKYCKISFNNSYYNNKVIKYHKN